MSDDKSAVHPVEWPAIWWRDQAFWREVATRTVAGTAAIVIVGSPVLIYAWINDLLPGDQVWAIVIGVSMFTVAALTWFTAFVLHRFRPANAVVELVRHRRLMKRIARAPKPLDSPEYDAASAELAVLEPKKVRWLTDRIVRPVIAIPVAWTLFGWTAYRFCNFLLESSN
ncbi:hypothetical protein [Rathayibacter sp. AY1C5]|uniref:hypothetical protein n=1 Tax=Rathayibacter sp. AY1C5 TaxID=2080538 RepID=UPI0011B0B1E8|nr:hypothetical protein [Rathayibacter sp. AY1C5]